jgi:hypothetical protein
MPELQTSFYRLTDKAEIQVKNKMGVAHPLACCLVTTPSANKKREALKDEELLTYCGHCTQSFQKDIATRHVLQVLFGSEYFMKRKNKLQRFANYLKFKKSLINQK